MHPSLGLLVIVGVGVGVDVEMPVHVPQADWGSYLSAAPSSELWALGPGPWAKGL
jgi:hypothetical protein